MARLPSAAAIAALILVMAAPAQARWGPPRTVVRAQPGVGRLLGGAAVDNRRNVMLVAFEHRGNGAGQSAQVVAVHGRLGRPLGGAQVLATGYGNVQLVANDAGQVAVIWSRLTQCPQALFCDQDVWIATGTAARGLARPLHLTARLPAVAHATVAINHAGDVVAAWPDSAGALGFARGNVRRGFGAPRSLAVPAAAVSAGIDRKGEALLAWVRNDAGASRAQAAWVGTGGDTGPLQTLAGGPNQEHASGAVTAGPYVAVAPGGRALIGWSGRWRSGQTHGPTALAVGRPGAAFRRRRTALPDLLTGLLAGARGGFAALFQPERGGSFRRAPSRGFVAAVADGMRFGRAHELARSAGDRAAVIDARGDAVFEWQGGNALRAVLRTSRGSFGRAVTLARGATQTPQLAANGRGDVLAAWAQGRSEAPRIVVRLLSR